MAMIKCPECSASVSDRAKACVQCGCPLQKTTGKVAFKASSEFIGLARSYKILDSNQREVARLKPGQTYEQIIEKDTKMFVKCGFGGPHELQCYGDQVNRFSVAMGQFGVGCVVARVDVIDSVD